MSGGSAGQKAAAEFMGVSVSGVQRAGKVRDLGVPELGSAVMAGHATLASAYWLAVNCTPAEQRYVLAEAAGSRTRLSHLVAALKREGSDYPPHQCTCRTCGRAI